MQGEVYNYASTPCTKAQNLDEGHMHTIYRYSFVALLTGLGGCTAYTSESTQLTGLANVCKDPRPQICTMEYRPVCATLTDASVKTFASGCSACSDAQVVSWVEGECPL